MVLINPFYKYSNKYFDSSPMHMFCQNCFLRIERLLKLEHKCTMCFVVEDDVEMNLKDNKVCFVKLEGLAPGKET